MPAPRRLRDARGPVAASVATAAALLTHLAGGGALPGWLGILVPWALSLAVCTFLAGRRLSLWRTTASVALSQVLFHTLFVLGTPTAAGGSAGGHLGHGVPAGLATSPAGIVAGSSEGSPSGLAELLQASPAMWFWHGAAVVATVAALYSGERVLVRLRELAGRMAQWVRRRFAVPASVVLPYPVVRTPAPAWFDDSFSARPGRSPLRRRGPPRAHAA
ncbi:hypothetical protein [Promicromonospora panici]|uniref:hypothetical protein n=1 Tax=Promicromonospora panici TaxID=2219658 RepID=UPI00101D113A|nr:hypothetical protein [Promicromonospora panici]